MRIALIHSFYSSEQPSGENQIVLDQQQALERAGHKVLLLARHTDDLSSRKARHISAAYSVATGYGPSPEPQLRAYGPDVIHMHNPFPNWGTRWLKRQAKPLIATLHNYRPLCANGLLFRDGAPCVDCPTGSSANGVRHRCYRDSALASAPVAFATRAAGRHNAILHSSDALITPSHRQRRVFESLGWMNRRYEVIPHFVSEVPYNASIMREKSWVFIGRLSHQKGILPLLDHWPKTGHQLYVYGEGPLSNEVQKRATGNITWSGKLASQDVPRTIQRAAGLIFPSLSWEPFGLTYAEALASGRPVIALRGSAAADDIGNEPHGRVISEWSELHDALEDVVSAGEAARTAALQRYQEAFSVDAWLERTERLYTELMSAR